MQKFSVQALKLYPTLSGNLVLYREPDDPSEEDEPIVSVNVADLPPEDREFIMAAIGSIITAINAGDPDVLQFVEDDSADIWLTILTKLQAMKLSAGTQPSSNGPLPSKN